jgi:hypothetical protein
MADGTSFGWSREEAKEMIHEANERDDPDKFEQECEDRWIEQETEDELDRTRHEASG